MNRRGFALLAVLWVLTALTALTGAGLVVARLGSETTRNRVLLARAEWAREACGEILLARFAADPATRHITTTDLGRGTWCRATVNDPAARLNVNTAEHGVVAQLFRALGVSLAVAESVTASRRRGTIYDLRQVEGMDSTLAARLAPFVTTRGPGAVNVNAARQEVLMLLPGMTEEGAALLISRRSTRRFRSVDEFAGALSRSSRARLLKSYADFVRGTVFDPPQLIATVEGGVRGTPIVARATLTMVPVPGRLAIIRRETE
ncbi:MAG: type II secretion system protein GspK [Gemmatimonadales bacterium]